MWRVAESDEEVAGFVYGARGFTRAVVRSAGHILPFDQPRAGRAMIGSWIKGEAPFQGAPGAATEAAADASAGHAPRRAASRR